MGERDPKKKSEVGEDLIRAIFGRAAIAESASLTCLGRCGSIFWNASPPDLQCLRSWVVTEPEAPDGDWCRDFRSLVFCGTGEYPKTVLKKGMKPFGALFEKRPRALGWCLSFD